MKDNGTAKERTRQCEYQTWHAGHLKFVLHGRLARPGQDWRQHSACSFQTRLLAIWTIFVHHTSSHMAQHSSERVQRVCLRLRSLWLYTWRRWQLHACTTWRWRLAASAVGGHSSLTTHLVGLFQRSKGTNLTSDTTNRISGSFSIHGHNVYQNLTANFTVNALVVLFYH